MTSALTLLIWLLVCIIVYVVVEAFLINNAPTDSRVKWLLRLLVVLILMIIFFMKSGINAL